MIKKWFLLGIGLLSTLLCGCSQTTTSNILITTPTTITTTTTGQVGINHPFSLTVGNGTENVVPFLLFISSYESVPEMGTFHADGPGAFGYDLFEYISQFPTLSIQGEVLITANEFTEWDLITVYSRDGIALGPYSVEMLSSLTEGTYYLRLFISQTEGEFYKYHYGFVTLVVE
ncbi:MAG TPA: hypothetical protein P5154_08090 [Candidatus Izemoplasmatales bacterium]|nr:hypothetical protein [Candidatus Izemoplasmatales bacterium]